MSAWVVPLVASVVALVVGIGADQLQWTGRTRRRLAADLEIHTKLADGEARRDLGTHIEVRTRLLVAMEEPLLASERQRQRRGRSLLLFGTLWYSVSWVALGLMVDFLDPDGQRAPEPFWLLTLLSVVVGVLVAAVGNIEVSGARADRRLRAREKYRRALGEPLHPSPDRLLFVRVYESFRSRREAARLAPGEAGGSGSSAGGA